MELNVYLVGLVKLTRISVADCAAMARTQCEQQ